MIKVRPLRLRKRAEFLSARAGKKIHSPLFLIEYRVRDNQEECGPSEPPRVGFTVTRKNGNAVIRNRIKRRLKEAVRVGLQHDMSNGIDYVFIARRKCLHVPFAELVETLQKRLAIIKKNAVDQGEKPN